MSKERVVSAAWRCQYRFQDSVEGGIGLFYVKKGGGGPRVRGTGKCKDAKL